jgi:crossover junction endodeoxyribonuclease RuvC
LNGNDTRAINILGLDPGLRRTGWGVIRVSGNRLSFVAAGVVAAKPDGEMAARLAELYAGLQAVIEAHAVDEAAVEETFVNRNPASTLKLGQARGVVLLAPAAKGLPVAEYAANLVKKSLVGFGHADKDQMQHMIAALLPGAELGKGKGAADAADALAVAICHAHHRGAAARKLGLLAAGGN